MQTIDCWITTGIMQFKKDNDTRNTIFSECSLELVKVLLLEVSDVMLVLNVGTSGFKVAIEHILGTHKLLCRVWLFMSYRKP
jgi:hypothetical protein